MFITATLCILIAGAPTPDAKYEAEKKRAMELIAKLAHDHFRVREEASRELAKLGGSARESLRLGLKHPDPEVRERCRKLLPQAITIHLNSQIETYFANPNGPLPSELPLLKRWTEMLGSDKESRELYRDILKKHQNVLVDMETVADLKDGADQPTQRFESFVREVYDRRIGHPTNPGAVHVSAVELNEAVLFLFLGSDPAYRKSPGATNYQYTNIFLSSPELAQKLSAENGSPLVRKLFAAWLEQEDTAITLARAFRMVSQYEIKECAPRAIVVSGMKNITPIYRSYALTALVRIGAKETIDDPRFQKLLEDKTVIRAGVNGAEIRDVALGVAIELSGQNTSDYGFDRTRPNTKAAFITYIYYSFNSEEKREAAHKKWKEWFESRPKR
jgi:hypothetical protein